MENSAKNIEDCTSLQQVRAHIDSIDEQVVALIAKRGAYVKQAATYKVSVVDVQSPQRVEQVIDKVVVLATSLGADAGVTEAVYRAMISGFIRSELEEYTARKNDEKHA